MRGRMTRARATHLPGDERLLDVEGLMRLDRAEARCVGVAAEAGVDVERAAELDRKFVPTCDRAQHVHDAVHLRVDGAPDTVPAVAHVAGLLVWNEAAGVMDRRERPVVRRLDTGDDRCHHVARPAERYFLRIFEHEKTTERVYSDGEKDGERPYGWGEPSA